MTFEGVELDKSTPNYCTPLGDMSGNKFPEMSPNDALTLSVFHGEYLHPLNVTFA
jgi:hypothetical protein